MDEYGTSATDVKAEHIWLVPEAANDNQAALFDPDVTLAQEPLAVASGTTVTWVHADHLGTPVLLTTATGTQANRYARAAFGQRLTSAATAPTTALSFPGQIIDANSTSATRHYNYMRHYDPTLGRYLAADPIGLDGGANVYAYVGGNPVTRVDPKGLATFQIGFIINLQLGPINFNGTHGVAIDTKGNVGTYTMVGSGGGAGAGGFAGINVGISNGDTIDDLGGVFANEGATVAWGPGFGIDTFGGKGTRGQSVGGGGVSFGTGEGARYSAGGSYAIVTPFGGPGCPQ